MLRINANYSSKDLLVNLIDSSLTLKAVCQISGETMTLKQVTLNYFRI